MKNLLVLIIVSNLFLLGACKTMQKSSTTTVVRDSVVVKTVIDTTKVEITTYQDSVRFDSLIHRLLSLQGDLLDQQINYEDSLAIERNKDEVIKYLTKGVYKDTTFVIPVSVEFHSKDSTFVAIGGIRVFFEDGKIGHKSHIDAVSVPTQTEITNIEYNKKITLWAWIKDPRTKGLLAFLVALLLLVFLLFKAKE